MRLLNTDTLKVEEFFGSSVPPYVILSHTWGKEEVTLQDVQTSQADQKAGYSKLRGCCTRAAQDGYKYVWIDTCCIDKTSSAELSEAINSMFKWYQNADKCYAYLVDVPKVDSNRSILSRSLDELFGDLMNSKWFTRGWTLQELIAPRIVEFYAVNWSEIGTKSSLREVLSKITRININVLDGADPSICNVAERFSWAAPRKTSRIEDAAYCLLGIFRVHMPLLYGEGQNALIRLQEQILKTTEDYTLLARGGHRGVSNRSALADNVNEFSSLMLQYMDWEYSDLELDRTAETLLRKSSKNVLADINPTLTAKGLHICLPLRRITDDDYLVYPYCKLNKTDELLCIRLRIINFGGNQFERKTESGFDHQLLPVRELKFFDLATIFIQQKAQHRVLRHLELSRTLRNWLLKVDATAVSEECTIKNGWGFRSFRTKVLPRNIKIRSWHPGTPGQSRTALICLGSREVFMVKFGNEFGKPWCQILLQRENVPGVGPNSDYWQNWESWSMYKNFFPAIPMDRVETKLLSGREIVYVSARKSAKGIVVDVRIRNSTALDLDRPTLLLSPWDLTNETDPTIRTCPV